MEDLTEYQIWMDGLRTRAEKVGVDLSKLDAAVAAGTMHPAAAVSAAIEMIVKAPKAGD